MAAVRKSIGKVAGSPLGKVGADLAGKRVGRKVEENVTECVELVADKDTAREVGRTAGNAANQVTSSLSRAVLSTEAGQTFVGEILGPHPGGAICSFCQGKTEIVLRVLALLGSLTALIAAAIALGVAHYDRSLQPNITTEEQFANTTHTENSTEFLTARGDLYGYVGYVIAITGLSILTEVLVIMIRLCNWGCVNLGINVYLTVDIILSIIFVLGHGAGGGVTIKYFLEYWNTDASGFGAVISFQVIRYSIGVSMAACFLCVALYFFLATWSILFVACGWNRKVNVETFKLIICSYCTC